MRGLVPAKLHLLPSRLPPDSRKRISQSECLDIPYKGIAKVCECFFLSCSIAKGGYVGNVSVKPAFFRVADELDGNPATGLFHGPIVHPAPGLRPRCRVLRHLGRTCCGQESDRFHDA